MIKKMALALTVAVFLIACGNLSAVAKEITLDQAKALARANNPTLTKYNITTEKAKYQLDKLEAERNDNWNSYNNMGARYSSLMQELAVLQEKLSKGDATVTGRINEVQAELRNLGNNLTVQYQKLTSSTEMRAAENTYSDRTIEAQKYRLQLDFEVEQAYIAMLNQEKNLDLLKKEYELSLNTLKNEKAKYKLGRSSGYQVDKLSAETNDLNRRIVEAGNSIRTAKGKFNNFIGREYGAELEVVAFDVADKLELPKQDELTSRAAARYLALAQLQRDIDQSEVDLADKSDYYESLLLSLGIKEKKLQLASEKQQVKQTVDQLISDAEAKYAAFQSAESNYQTADKTLKWEQIRFSLGQISKQALLQSELNYCKVEGQKAAAAYALYLAERALQLAEEGILH